MMELGALARATKADLDAAWSAKVAGAIALDRLLAGRDLDAFVLYSSIAATWGSGRQGAYAAANGALDAIAESRKARGDVALSVSWGPWSGGGMASGDAETRELRAVGLLPLAPSVALDALKRALASKDAVATIAEVDWDSVPSRLQRRPEAAPRRGVRLAEAGAGAG